MVGCAAGSRHVFGYALLQKEKSFVFLYQSTREARPSFSMGCPRHTWLTNVILRMCSSLECSANENDIALGIMIAVSAISLTGRRM